MEGKARKHLHPLKRKQLIYHYAVMYGTGSVTEIRDLIKRDTGFTVGRETIHKDLRTMNDNVAEWTHGQAKSQWMARVQRMYVDTNLQILNIQKVIQTLISQEADAPKELVDAINLISEPDERADAVKKLEGLMKNAQAHKYGGKMAYLISIMIEAQKHLVDVMTGQPLYAKLQEYSKQHEAITNVGK